jgi:hypothetical protein
MSCRRAAFAACSVTTLADEATGTGAAAVSGSRHLAGHQRLRPADVQVEPDDLRLDARAILIADGVRRGHE